MKKGIVKATVLLALLPMPAAAQYPWAYGPPSYWYDRPPPGPSYYNYDVQMRGGPSWYCRNGWAPCRPDGTIARFHTGEHCMMRPQDC